MKPLLTAVVVAATALLAGAQSKDYLQASLVPPWVTTTESTKIEVPEPPTPSTPPAPPKDGAIWGTFYPDAPPPPPPPPPPLPFPLAAAAGGDKPSGTNAPSNFIELLSQELNRLLPANQAATVPGLEANSPDMAALGAALLALASSQQQLHPAAEAVSMRSAVPEAAGAADEAASSAVSSILGSLDMASPAGASAAAAVNVDLASVIGGAGLAANQAGKGARAERVAVRRSAASLLQTTGTASRRLRASSSAGAEPSVDALAAAAAADLESDATSFAREAAADRGEEAAAAEAAVPPELHARLMAHARETTATHLLAHAAAVPRFAEASVSAYRSKRVAAARALREAAMVAQKMAHRALSTDASASVPAGLAEEDAMRFRAAAEASTASMAEAGAESAETAETKLGLQNSLHWGLNYNGGAYSFPFNPYSAVASPYYGPANLGMHPFGGPLYANYGYFPPSSAILKGQAGPLGDGKGGVSSSTDHGKGKFDNNGDPTKGGKDDADGAYNPGAPPFFMRGTGWPYPYFMNPSYAPPAALNPINTAHYNPGANSVPVNYWW